MAVDGRMRHVMIRSKCLPWGTQGGKEGAGNIAFAIAPDGAEQQVGRTHNFPLPAGWKVHLMTGGGGGYGDPFERPAEKVREDVKAGYISRAAAEKDYGVVFRSAGLDIDEEATAKLRKSRAMEKVQ
jgi:N-methylhydantoinase B